MQNYMSAAPLSVFCFWIKGTFTLTDTAVEVSIPNRLFGCIPVGSQKTAIPLRSISGCQIDTWYSASEMIAGIIFLLLGICSASTSAIIALIISLFSFGLILSSIHTVFRIQNNGTEFAVNIPVYGKTSITKFERVLSATLCEQTAQN